MLDPEIVKIIKPKIDSKLKPPKDIEGLNKLIKKKNKVTKQLNNLYRGIEYIEKAINIPKQLIETAEKSIPILETSVTSVAFIPSTVTTPIPVGPILLSTGAIELLEDLIKIDESKVNSWNSELSFLKIELNKVIELLGMLDLLIQASAKELSKSNGGGEISTQESVSKELLDSTQEQSNQLSPVVTNVNGFEMGVVTVGENTGNDLRRRQAVARNSQGIVMLQGDPSFSSNDQILIDELVYYIQQNKLKA
jgi:hypothetical protein